MHSFTSTIIPAIFLASLTSAAVIPLQARDTCGSVPKGTGSQSPLSQPSGITTAEACQSSCDSNSSCQSFCFGMVNSNVECILFSVAAAQVPPQSSTNLLVFDKACTNVPNVVPTSSNPTGANTGSTTGSTTGSNTSSNTGTGANQGTGNNGAGVTPNNAQGANARGHKLAVRNQCGGAPKGPTGKNVTPVSTPANINSLAACEASCKATGSCQSFEFGSLTPGGQDVCHLFAVPAANVPAPTSGQSLVVYDVACSL